MYEKKTDDQALNDEIRDLLDCSTHAMRTPLWALSEFSRMLEEETGAKLGESERESLDHIRSGAGRLSALVESLTQLAVLCRQPMEKQCVDLSALAQATARELEAATPERKAQFVSQPGLTAQADPALMQKLLGILLGNSWKFTKLRTAAEIQFGRNPANGAFFVRDNGVGFDEALAYKLFRPFQRLHAAEDFDGQGMGLTVARRIVHLHGGRIWAQGKVGEGATFFFTLNNGEK